jgi:hypothetical protein
MSEQDQYEVKQGEAKPIPMPPMGPHSGSTLDAPPRPEAVQAYNAMIRKDLRKQRKQSGS